MLYFNFEKGLSCILVLVLYPPLLHISKLPVSPVAILLYFVIVIVVAVVTTKDNVFH